MNNFLGCKACSAATPELGGLGFTPDGMYRCPMRCKSLRISTTAEALGYRSLEPA